MTTCVLIFYERLGNLLGFFFFMFLIQRSVWRSVEGKPQWIRGGHQDVRASPETVLYEWTWYLHASFNGTWCITQVRILISVSWGLDIVTAPVPFTAPSANGYQTHWQLVPSTALAPVPCRINGLIAISKTHFVPWQKCCAVPCRLKDA